VGLRILIGKVLQLALGVILGGIIGGIATGDENYILLVGIGTPVVLTVAGLVGAAAAVRTRRATASATGGRPPGIISTMPEVAGAKQQEAVLNPVSTAQPSAGVVLNGQVVGAAKPGRPAIAVAGPGRVAWNILSVITIVVGAALALIPAYQSLAWIGTDIAAGRPFDGRNMVTGLHQPQAFDQIADLIGSTEVTSINFYDDYLSVSAPVPGAREVDRYVFKYGRAYREGPDYSQPADLREALFDAGDIDMSLIARLVSESTRDSGIDDIDGIYPSITRFSGGSPEIGIAISGVYFDAYYDYTLTGELIQRSGSAFE
jgi:hypothetical protein